MAYDAMNGIALIKSQTEGQYAEIVYFALLRSFSRGQIATSTLIQSELNSGIVAIHPNKSLLKLLCRGRKILALGHLDSQLSEVLGIHRKKKGPNWNRLWDINPGKYYDASAGSVIYTSDNGLKFHLPYKERKLLRFDFEREWNNHGYGGISNHDSTWDISFRAEPSSSVKPLAWIVDGQGKQVGLYAGLIDFPEASVLWFNRSVGPVDSLEWSIVETFFSEYRADELACFPYIRDIPYGYDGAVCMHADCDEAISSCAALFDLYRQHHIPFSLAIKTGQTVSSQDFTFMHHVMGAGGSVSSHSKSHFENWGGDQHVAYQEGITSKHWLEKHVTGGEPVHYAVSPFYQNPPYAVQALVKAGYKGFVGGIICNDPEYLLGRAGQVPFCDGRIVSHSQQCMLHGDCFHRYGNSIIPYIKAFECHKNSGGFFGYLDHPFSKRYSYGWNDERERLNAHADFIAYMKTHGHIWFANLDQCLGFVRKKSDVSILIDENGDIKCNPFRNCSNGLPDLGVSYRGTISRIEINPETFI